MALIDTRKEDIERHLAKYPNKRSAVMPLLYMAQEEYGHITPDAIEEIAGLLEMSATDVKSLVGFYTMYHDRPKGRYLIQICDDLPCALRGSGEILAYLIEKLGIQPGETTEDGLFTLETVMCIAACDRAPVIQVNFHYHEFMTKEKVDALIDELRRQAAEEG
jgi:NADH-quinone oxidoreductase subunit E